jgi:hypothetical protein
MPLPSRTHWYNSARSLPAPADPRRACGVGHTYAATGAILSWSFTTIAVAAKNLMASVPDYLLIERAFTALQWIIVGPLTALAFEPPVAQGKPAGA